MIIDSNILLSIVGMPLLLPLGFAYLAPNRRVCSLHTGPSRTWERGSGEELTRAGSRAAESPRIARRHPALASDTWILSERDFEDVMC